MLTQICETDSYDSSEVTRDIRCAVTAADVSGAKRVTAGGDDDDDDENDDDYDLICCNIACAANAS